MAAPPSSYRPRPTHRRRFSPLSLSSDTTATLPEYTAPRPLSARFPLPDPLEKPPDYPDSAEEADEETDDSVSLSPRRHRRYLTHSRSASNQYKKFPYANHSSSISDTYLDSLLERSVNALELSNTLLRSSMSTQSSLSTVLSPDHRAEQVLESRARLLNNRIRNNDQFHRSWMDDLDEVAEGVEDLFQGEEDSTISNSQSFSVSRSLPSAIAPIHRHTRRRPSLEPQRTSGSSRVRRSSSPEPPPSTPPRPAPTSPPVSYPRSNAGGSHNQTSPYRRSGARTAPYPASFYDDPSFNLPSSFSSASSNLTLRRSRSSASSTSTISRARSTTPQVRDRSADPPSDRSHSTKSRSRSWSRSSNPSHHDLHLSLRPLEPPIEELPSQSDSSTSSNDQTAFRTVQSLRRILDEQPVSNIAEGKKPATSPRSPLFSPRSPPVAPTSSTSNTTTTISKLYTKASHSTSTRPPSPPRQSSLKRTSGSSLTIPDSDRPISRSSSGASTPRQVAFGPLPEPYSSSKDGSTARFKERKKKRGKEKRMSEGESSWWRTWLTGGSMLSMSAARHEEKIEERVARSWGRPGAGSNLEDWAV